MKETQIFKRGQVWYINDNAKAVGSIQAKSRPYCIVSNDKCNAYSPVIHMAPITTQDKSDLPTHIQIFDPYHKEYQTILVEQTMPKSIPDILRVANYKYTITEEKMKEIDKALSVQFGISNNAINLDDFEELLDMLVEQKLSQVREESDKLTDSRAERYLSKLFDKIDKTVISDKPTENTVITNTITAPAPIMSTPEQQAPVIKKKTSPRSRWTPELKSQFLADTRDPSMSKEQILEKYSITASTYNTVKSKLQREVGIHSNSGRKKSDSSSQNRAKLDHLMKEYLDYYNANPISDVVREYKLPSKEAAVELASQYRMKLGE